MCLELGPLFGEGRGWSFCVSVGATFVPPAAAKFLLVLARRVILGSESQRIHGLISLSNGSGSLEASALIGYLVWLYSIGTKHTENTESQSLFTGRCVEMAYLSITMSMSQYVLRLSVHGITSHTNLELHNTEGIKHCNALHQSTIKCYAHREDSVCPYVSSTNLLKGLRKNWFGLRHYFQCEFISAPYRAI